MTDSPNPVDALALLADKFNERHPATLHAGTAIVAWMKDLPRNPLPADHTAALLGLRVVVSPDCESGEWRIDDQHGHELGRGRVGEPGQIVVWHAGAFYVFDPAALNLGGRP